MTDIFAEFFRRDVEFYSGKINKTSGLWRYIVESDNISPEEMKKLDESGHAVHYLPDGKYFFLSKGFDEKPIICVNGPGVSGCTNEDYEGIYTKLKKHETYCVPFKVCRKCRFYTNARDSKRRYATCKLKAVANPKRAAANDFFKSLSDAVKETNEIMK